MNIKFSKHPDRKQHKSDIVAHLFLIYLRKRPNFPKYVSAYGITLKVYLITWQHLVDIWLFNRL